jgi:CRISPR/Cas system-associated endonuclease Cas3-HD
MFYKQPSENRFYRHETTSAHFTFIALLEKGMLANKRTQVVVLKHFASYKRHSFTLWHERS